MKNIDFSIFSLILEVSFFLVDREIEEKPCKKSHSIIFQHKIEGLIIGIGLSNSKENMALALALYDKLGKGRVHMYYIRIYETFSNYLDFPDLRKIVSISKNFNQKNDGFSKNQIINRFSKSENSEFSKLENYEVSNKSDQNDEFSNKNENNEFVENKKEEFSNQKNKDFFNKNKNILTKNEAFSGSNADFTDVFLGNGNVVLALTLEENMVVYFRMFDDVLFNTSIKFIIINQIIFSK